MPRKAPQVSQKWNAKAYNTNSEIQLKWAELTLKHFSPKEHSCIMDVGCGDGKITALISKHYPEISAVGVDSSPEMIQHANQNYKNTNLSFYIQNIETYRSGSQFDWILSFSCFHWVQNKLTLFKSVRENLKTGGYLLFCMSPTYSIDPMGDAIKSTLTDKKWERLLGGNVDYGIFTNSQAEIEKTLKSLGFKTFLSKILPTEFIFKDATLFQEWIRSWLPHLQTLPQKLHNEILSDIIKKYKANVLCTDDYNIKFIDYILQVGATC